MGDSKVTVVPPFIIGKSGEYSHAQTADNYVAGTPLNETRTAYHVSIEYRGTASAEFDRDGKRYKNTREAESYFESDSEGHALFKVKTVENGQTCEKQFTVDENLAKEIYAGLLPLMQEHNRTSPGKPLSDAEREKVGQWNADIAQSVQVSASCPAYKPMAAKHER